MRVNTEVSMRYARLAEPRIEGEPAGMQTMTRSNEAAAVTRPDSPDQSVPILPTGSIFDVAGVVPTLYRDVLISRWQHENVSTGDDLLAGLPPKLPVSAVVQTPPPPARVRETVETVSTPIFAASLRLSA